MKTLDSFIVLMKLKAIVEADRYATVLGSAFQEKENSIQHQRKLLNLKALTTNQRTKRKARNLIIGPRG